MVPWDGSTIGPWISEIDGADVVINLAGRSVNCRYDARNREEIMASRVLSTRAVGEAIARSARPPRLWIQASTATIYSHRFDAPNDEYTGIIGGGEPGAPRAWDFSIDVAKAWESAVDESDTLTTRKVKLRSAIVMSPDRKAPFEILLRLVRFGAGGRLGDGEQFTSWVHHLDFVRAVEWIIEDEDISGVVNVAAPNPLRNDEFMRALRDAWGSSIGIPGPRWLLEIATAIYGTETELLLKSRRVIGRKLRDHGFEFRFPTWQDAARDLCDEWRELNGRELRRHVLAGSPRF